MVAIPLYTGPSGAYAGLDAKSTPPDRRPRCRPRVVAQGDACGPARRRTACSSSGPVAFVGRSVTNRWTSRRRLVAVGWAGRGWRCQPEKLGPQAPAWHGAAGVSWSEQRLRPGRSWRARLWASPMVRDAAAAMHVAVRGPVHRRSSWATAARGASGEKAPSARGVAGDRGAGAQGSGTRRGGRWRDRSVRTSAIWRMTVASTVNDPQWTHRERSERGHVGGCMSGPRPRSRA